MKMYYPDQEDIAAAITETIEKDTGEKIFTIRLLENDPEDLLIEGFIVFENKDMLHAFISVQQINGQLACRIQGNYL